MKPSSVQAFSTQMPWDSNPIYAVLHESIYCQGAASSWAAERVRSQHFSAGFDAEACARNNSPVMFTGASCCLDMFGCACRNSKRSQGACSML